MNLNKLNSWLMLAANIGVLASLVFIGFEIRQNTAQMRGEASYSITEAVNNLNASIHDNGELAEIHHRGERSFDALTSVEQDRMRAFWFSELNLVDFVIQLEQEGIKDVQFDVVDYFVWKFRTKPGRRQFWESIKDDWRGSEELYRLIEQPR